MTMSQPAVKTDVTIILVRHGYVNGIDPPRFRGRQELPLTPLGKRQAKALSRRIAAEWRPKVIFTSPLGRCVETAHVIGEPYGLGPEPVPALNDVDYGAWQGMTEDEVHAKWPEAWACWRQTPQLAEFPRGETMAELVKRATNALHAILSRHAGQTIVIVSHDSVSQVLLLHALALPLSHYRALVQSPCGLNVLRFDRQQFTIRSLNETGHLLGC